jgi:hypothetical protein
MHLCLQIREVSGPGGQKLLAMLRGDTRLPHSDQFPLPSAVRSPALLLCRCCLGARTRCWPVCVDVVTPPIK